MKSPLKYKIYNVICANYYNWLPIQDQNIWTLLRKQRILKSRLYLRNISFFSLAGLNSYCFNMDFAVERKVIYIMSI